MKRHARRLLHVLGAALLAGAACGCEVDPLFPEGADRTPFDRYDAVRNQDEPATSLDIFGRKQPNLRGRLSRR
ncbi:MAG: hypothetical protein ACF8R7_18085 [Phycisphaerales bacterium JB039]